MKPQKVKNILDAVMKRNLDEHRDVFELTSAGGAVFIQFVGNDLVIRHVPEREMWKEVRHAE